MVVKQDYCIDIYFYLTIAKQNFPRYRNVHAAFFGSVVSGGCRDAGVVRKNIVGFVHGKFVLKLTVLDCLQRCT